MGVAERLQDMGPATRGHGQRSLEVVGRTAIADFFLDAGKVCIDAPAGKNVEDVARNNPGDNKSAKYHVADDAEPEVFKALGELYDC